MTKIWSVTFDEEEGDNVIYEAENLKALLVQLSSLPYIADNHALSIRETEYYFND